MLFPARETGILVLTSDGVMRVFTSKLTLDTWMSRQRRWLRIAQCLVLPRQRKPWVTIHHTGLVIGFDHPWYRKACELLRRAQSSDGRMSQGE